MRVILINGEVINNIEEIRFEKQFIRLIFIGKEDMFYFINAIEKIIP